jgi:hypothetical protein
MHQGREGKGARNGAKLLPVQDLTAPGSGLSMGKSVMASRNMKLTISGFTKRNAPRSWQVVIEPHRGVVASHSQEGIKNSSSAQRGGRESFLEKVDR